MDERVIDGVGETRSLRNEGDGAMLRATPSGKPVDGSGDSEDGTSGGGGEAADEAAVRRGAVAAGAAAGGAASGPLAVTSDAEDNAGAEAGDGSGGAAPATPAALAGDVLSAARVEPGARTSPNRCRSSALPPSPPRWARGVHDGETGVLPLLEPGAEVPEVPEAPPPAEPAPRRLREACGDASSPSATLSRSSEPEQSYATPRATDVPEAVRPSAPAGPRGEPRPLRVGGGMRDGELRGELPDRSCRSEPRSAWSRRDVTLCRSRPRRVSPAAGLTPDGGASAPPTSPPMRAACDTYSGMAEAGGCASGVDVGVRG